MTHKLLYLAFVVDVPHAHDAVLAARHEVLSVGTDGTAEHLVEMAFD